jgi:hypothetical protein
MSAFASEDDLDWRRIDVTGIVTHAGIATVRNAELGDCLRWLSTEEYQVARLNCAKGFRDLRRQIGDLFSWQAQFGYHLDDGTESPPNLNALRDGFGFSESPGSRRILAVERLESVWDFDASWSAGLLAIASEYSRVQLALGRRFLTLVALPEVSPLVGIAFESLQIPFFGWDRARSRPVAG